MGTSGKVSSFQSAPLNEARGDGVEMEELVTVLMFQSAPLNEARGDMVFSRQTFLISFVMTTKFQSAPLNEARGDIGVANGGRSTRR